MAAMHGGQNQSSYRLGQCFLLAVAVNEKEYMSLIFKTQKLAKYALHISPLRLRFLYFAPRPHHQQQPLLRCNHCLFVFDRQLIMIA